MKKTQIVKELNAKDNIALNKELVELGQKMAKLQLDVAMRKLKNVKEIEDTRKRVARIFTILNERAIIEVKTVEAKNEVVK